MKSEVDFEIKNAGGEIGLGVFALRPFHKNDKVMVERPFFFMNNARSIHLSDSAIPSAAQPAVEALSPLGGSIVDKVMRNRLSVGNDIERGDSALFVTMSRVNHDCTGNTDHSYHEHRGVKILVASCDVEKGEEITFSYVAYIPREQCRMRLFLAYGFRCNCNLCNDKELEAKVSSCVYKRRKTSGCREVQGSVKSAANPSKLLDLVRSFI